MAKQATKNANLKHLLSPIKIGPVELKNRMVLAPMNETFSGHDGQATEQMVSYFGARAKGGAAWVSTGAIMGTRLSSKFVWGRNIYLFHEGHIQGLNLLTDRIHYFDSLATAQMTIGFGRQGHSYDHTLKVPAPSAGLPYEIAMEKIPKTLEGLARIVEMGRLFMVGQMTREMTIEEIRSEQKEFARSCQLAVIAGFDVIEIHGPHGYLEHQFLSPLTNKRTDLYGGEWRNRKRFLNEIMEQIRYACPGVAVGVRISNQEYMEGGLTIEEMIDVAKDLEARGADYISLSAGGGYEESGHLITDKDRAEHLPESAAKFKKALKVPVIIASQHDPVKSDKDIASGKYDINALGRQLFCDPEYPNKVASGDIDKIKYCTYCNTCVLRCLSGAPPACPRNPIFGREYAMDEYKIGPRQKHEDVIPKGIISLPMPALERPWWKPELPVLEKCWRKFTGPGPR
jgi:2,4-dienoyl-CoA reductase-like NADH-dependent reductase (Old Yellow Enzyme family)